MCHKNVGHKNHTTPPKKKNNMKYNIIKTNSKHKDDRNLKGVMG